VNRPAPRVIDTYPAFLQFWAAARDEPLERQIERWADEYLAPWPGLLALQQADYAGQNLDWRAVARERIFPYFDERLPAMAAARANLLTLGPELYQLARQVLGIDPDAAFVIHVGIGGGAGWVTTYEGRPAILFGLENIAECGWSDAGAIRGLVAHELGHVVHYAWRAEPPPAGPEEPWWQLYGEGFAQRCEQLILGEASWHEAERADDDDWLAWCRAHRAWLAAEFLRDAEAGEPVQRFFGSWFEIEGHSQCGYFLGCEAIRALEAAMSLAEIARLEDPAARLRPVLAGFAT
jgi:hypothetical protein